MTTRAHMLLLHGVTNSSAIWDEVVPLLRDDFDLIVPTARGHRGGLPVDGKATVVQLVDDVEALLDQRTLHQVHIAGNSLGGWVALELARRGRALSVCALSPAGFWTAGDSDESHATNTIRKARTLARLARPITHIAMRSRRLRTHFLRDVATNGERLKPAAAQTIVDDLIECSAAPDLLGTREQLRGFETLPCPITVAWSAEDRIFPPDVNGTTARALIPGATYIELPAVGHIPMIDDPALVAEVIRNAATASLPT